MEAWLSGESSNSRVVVGRWACACVSYVAGHRARGHEQGQLPAVLHAWLASVVQDGLCVLRGLLSANPTLLSLP